MCGIVAIFDAERGATQRDAARAASALAHRGPDGQTAAMYADGLCALGHSRLALVDVRGGAQPIENENGDIACVVSGELYDDGALRAALESRGHRFRTRSDSEVCLHLYEEHGDAFVDHLRGEFAIAIFDARRRRLVCARDRFGVRSLVWARGPRGFAVASEAKALFALGVRPRWNADAVWLSMHAQYATEAQTPFAGVSQVPAGHLLVVDENGARLRRYWDLDLPSAADKRDVSPEELRDALAEAVKLRLRADAHEGDRARIACTLSGGIDSSAIAALASQTQGDLPCFSLSFEHALEYDELAIAERTAAHLGARLHPVRVSHATLWEELPHAVAQSEGFSINLHVAAKWILAREVRRAGHRVLLTGEGADEVLAGYAHFRRDLMAPGDDAVLARENPASAGLMMPEGARLDVRAVERALGFVPSWIEAKAALGHRASTLLSKDFAATFAGRDPYAELIASLDVDGQLRGRERIDQSAYTWTKLALGGYILRTLGDGTEMAHAVEGRVPFLDHRFFEVARATRTEAKIRGAEEKHLLRAAMRSALPEEVVARRKHPLLAPPFAAARSRAFDEAAELLRSPALPSFFDRRAMTETLEDVARAPERTRALWDPPLMLALTATLLGRHYRMAGA